MSIAQRALLDALIRETHKYLFYISRINLENPDEDFRLLFKSRITSGLSLILNYVNQTLLNIVRIWIWICIQEEDLDDDI